MIPLRCHSLSEIMAEPKKKGETLSEGGKTAMRKLAKQLLYEVRFGADNKFTQKGLQCEDTSIELLNLVMGATYRKNTERRTTPHLTGEPDIVHNDHGIDIKTSWSLETFPVTPEEADKIEYEWQCRAYMHLFNKPVWHVAYCMVDTPPELCRYENPELHQVWRIPPEQRVTIVTYTRDMAKEAAMLEKVKAAQAFLDSVIVSVKGKRAILADLNPQLAEWTPTEPNWANNAARAAFS